MKKMQRRVLFYALIGIFFVVTPIVLVYAIGYSIDLRNQSFIPAGGIFLKTNQTGIKIYIDGKEHAEHKETSFLTTGALFNNLRAGTYAVKIEKEGFRPWERTIEVRQRVVSEFRTIFLVPQEVPIIERKEVVRIGGTFEYHISPDGTYTALLFNKGFILTLEKNADSSIILRKENKTPFKKFIWLDAKTLAVQSVADGSEWLVIEIVSDSHIIETPVRIKGEKRFEVLRYILKHPLKARTFFVLSADGVLYTYSGAAQKSEKVLDQVVYAAVDQDRILFINDKGFFATADLSGNSIMVAGRPGVFLRGDFQTFSAANGIHAIIDGVGGIFLFDSARQEEKVLPIHGAARKISFIENGIRALLQKQNGLAVLFTTSEKEAPFRKAGDVVSVLENFSEEIRDSIWYDKRYILFSTATALYGLEFGTGPNDSIVQKLASLDGFLFTDGKRITVVNDRAISVIAIE